VGGERVGTHPPPSAAPSPSPPHTGEEKAGLAHTRSGRRRRDSLTPAAGEKVGLAHTRSWGGECGTRSHPQRGGSVGLAHTRSGGEGGTRSHPQRGRRRDSLTPAAGEKAGLSHTRSGGGGTRSHPQRGRRWDSLTPAAGEKAGLAHTRGHCPQDRGSRRGQGKDPRLRRSLSLSLALPLPQTPRGSKHPLGTSLRREGEDPCPGWVSDTEIPGKGEVTQGSLCRGGGEKRGISPLVERGRER